MPCIDMVETGRRIREMRIASGMTVKEIQEIFGFGSQNTIYKWPKGESLPTIDNFVVLAKIFATTIDAIIAVK